MTKKLFLFVLMVFFTTNFFAQEVNANQYWELIKDHNSNGWADPGDIIEFTVNLSVTSKGKEILSFENQLSDVNLLLIPGSVQSSTGQILTGNNNGDSEILLNNLTFEPPYDNESVVFQTKIKSDITSPIPLLKNYSVISSSTLEKMHTNRIEIMCKGYDKEIAESNDFLFIYIALISGLTFLLIHVLVNHSISKIFEPLVSIK